MMNLALLNLTGSDDDAISNLFSLVGLSDHISASDTGSTLAFQTCNLDHPETIHQLLTSSNDVRLLVLVSPIDLCLSRWGWTPETLPAQVSLWNRYCQSALDLVFDHMDRSSVISFTALLEDPENVFSVLEQQLGVPKPTAPAQPGTAAQNTSAETLLDCISLAARLPQYRETQDLYADLVAIQRTKINPEENNILLHIETLADRLKSRLQADLAAPKPAELSHAPEPKNMTSDHDNTALGTPREPVRYWREPHVQTAEDTAAEKILKERLQNTQNFDDRLVSKATPSMAVWQPRELSDTTARLARVALNRARSRLS